MQQGFFGITWPRLGVGGELLFGVYRGLVPLSPILLLVPVGLMAMWREPTTRVAAIAIAAISLSFLWINASYFYWHGGGSAGPRHLVAMLPLMSLALAFAWPREEMGTDGHAGIACCQPFLSLVCAVVGMFPRPSIQNPMADFSSRDFSNPRTS